MNTFWAILSVVGMIVSGAFAVSDIRSGQYGWAAVMVACFFLNLNTLLSTTRNDASRDGGPRY